MVMCQGVLRDVYLYLTVKYGRVHTTVQFILFIYVNGELCTDYNISTVHTQHGLTKYLPYTRESRVHSSCKLHTFKSASITSHTRVEARLPGHPDTWP